MSSHAGPANWWTTGTDSGKKHISTKGISQSGLLLNLDAGVSSSYPGSGTTWTDLSGNNNNGTLVNSPTYSSGVINTDGVSSYISITGSPISGNITSAVTMSCFMKITSTTLYGNIVGYNNPGNVGQLFSFQVRSTSNTSPANITFVLYTTAQYLGGTTYTAYTSVPFNQWHCVTGTYDGTYMKVYLDGVKVATDTASGAFSSSSNLIYLGSDSTRNRWAAGSWNDFLIYNRALSDSEVLKNFQALKFRYGI